MLLRVCAQPFSLKCEFQTFSLNTSDIICLLYTKCVNQFLFVLRLCFKLFFLHKIPPPQSSDLESYARTADVLRSQATDQTYFVFFCLLLCFFCILMILNYLLWCLLMFCITSEPYVRTSVTWLLLYRRYC